MLDWAPAQLRAHPQSPSQLWLSCLRDRWII